MFEHEAGFEGKTNCLPWFALTFGETGPTCGFSVCLRFNFFPPGLPRTPDHALTSCVKPRGVSDGVVEGKGSAQDEKHLFPPQMKPPSLHLAAYKISCWPSADSISCFSVSAPGLTIISQQAISLRCQGTACIMHA